ncbi:MAG TPA: CpsB/CapC family capsule biosynthesis tyrosine phosphatase, partial [Desulfatiglandales bacterium]|nr:CpsB/CapC family capsule biosynthesis tyrosine phosphatase [Desulfatiglandales bacterium]
MIDLHCHILPGLDDGARTFEEALKMVRIAQSDGIKTIVATPHLFRGGFATGDLASIEEKRRTLNDALGENAIEVEIKSGAEVHISHNLIDEIRAHRNSLTINGSAYMFIEFPSGHIYPGVKNL